ncbi:NADH-quinone oxidoreductase subunit F [bacterium]|nr:MAG: NADH-quinone oxidoreductase subunit F [bacterium]
MSRTLPDLATIRDQLQLRIEARRRSRRGALHARREVLVCTGGGCLSSQSSSVADALEREIASRQLGARARVIRVGCMGLCAAGPLVLVSPDGVLYHRVDAAGVKRIVAEHVGGNRPVADLELTHETADGEVLRSRDVPFFARQQKIALRNCGVVDPLEIDEYIALDGYVALEKVLFHLTPEQVLDTVHESGLRGRGGAGFPAGLKWQWVRETAGDEKYVICNADEGDPGAFTDRSILEGDPHSVIEAMIIAGRVVGAQHGLIYVRAEYPLAIERLELALQHARDYGLLGKRILDSDFSFELEIAMGAGAFICGEETALLHSIEGRRGTARPRPPFPAERGLWGRPTLINNVETWANIPPIIDRGAEWFAEIGTEGGKGTKVFTLAGNVRNSGLVEVPMGFPLREIVEEIGGGMRSNMEFKAAHCGGPSGGCIPEAAADVPIGFESLRELGAMMGSGGLAVIDEGSCMVELTRYFLDFLVDESCGKCPPCRIGISVMLKILERIIRGEAEISDLESLESIGKHVQRTSLCGLGRTAPNAVLSTLHHFREEYEAHLFEGRCPAAQCRDLKAQGSLAQRRAGRIARGAGPESCAYCGSCLIVCPNDPIHAEDER